MPRPARSSSALTRERGIAPSSRSGLAAASCAFCIVRPPAAGAGARIRRSVSSEALVGAGYGEVTLTGVDIGHYGWDLLPRTSVAALVARIAEVPGLRWLRLSSVLPSYFTSELIQAVTTLPVVVPHLHLPLQSGSDRVLRLMRRPYNTAMYRTLVEQLVADIPDLGLGADIIVGHPGEEEAGFGRRWHRREAPLSTSTFRVRRRKGRTREDWPPRAPR